MGFSALQLRVDYHFYYATSLTAKNAKSAKKD